MKIETSKVIHVTADIDVRVEKKNGRLHLVVDGDAIEIGHRGASRMLMVLFGMSEKECVAERGGSELYFCHKIEPFRGYECRFDRNSSPLFRMDVVDAFAFRFGLERALADAVFHED